MDSIRPLSVQSNRDDPQDNGPKGGGYDELGRGPNDKQQNPETGEQNPSATS